MNLWDTFWSIFTSTFCAIIWVGFLIILGDTVFTYMNEEKYLQSSIAAVSAMVVFAAGISWFITALITP